jgi:two-component system, NtrC family, sensor kinase
MWPSSRCVDICRVRSCVWLKLVHRGKSRSLQRTGRQSPSTGESALLNDVAGGESLEENAVDRVLECAGWLVFVELPLDEAYAPIYRSFLRSGAILLAALVLAAFAGLYLARRMVIPIRALRDGAVRIGRGDRIGSKCLMRPHRP